jgi:type I restriction enzyme S subunit
MSARKAKLNDANAEASPEPLLSLASLPVGWEWSRLGDICRTTSGGTPSRKYARYFSGNIPWVKSGELPDGVVTEVEERITEEAVTNSSAKLFPAGTLLIALYGATVGKLGILKRDATTNQAVCAIFPPEHLDMKYLFWYLRFVRPDLVAQAIGGAQPNISQGILRTLPIPVAPLDQQKQIVAEIEKQFSRLDEAVANLKRVKANLKRYKAAVLKAAVEGRLVETEAELARKEGRNYETGEQLLQRILETRRSQWKGKGKYKEPAAPDTTDLPELPEGATTTLTRRNIESCRVVQSNRATF